jgi:acyl carrier protein
MNNELKKIVFNKLKSIPHVFMDDIDEKKILNTDFDISFDQLALDSLAKMELIIWLEIEYGIEINEVDLENLKSINNLTCFIENHI